MQVSCMLQQHLMGHCEVQGAGCESASEQELASQGLRMISTWEPGVVTSKPPFCLPAPQKASNGWALVFIWESREVWPELKETCNTWFWGSLAMHCLNCNPCAGMGVSHFSSLWMWRRLFGEGILQEVAEALRIGATASRSSSRLCKTGIP